MLGRMIWLVEPWGVGNQTLGGSRILPLAVLLPSPPHHRLTGEQVTPSRCQSFADQSQRPKTPLSRSTLMLKFFAACALESSLPLMRRLGHAPVPVNLLLTCREYVERVALYSKPVWTCRLTGHTGMTYDQARSSELAAHKVLEGFNEWWKPYCLTSIHCCTPHLPLSDPCDAYSLHASHGIY